MINFLNIDEGAKRVADRVYAALNGDEHAVAGVPPHTSDRHREVVQETTRRIVTEEVAEQIAPMMQARVHPRRVLEKAYGETHKRI